MSETSKSVLRFKYFTVFCIFTLGLTLIAYSTCKSYIDYSTPKTVDYYRDKSFQMCIENIQRQTVFTLTDQQIESCAKHTKAIYDNGLKSQ